MKPEQALHIIEETQSLTRRYASYGRQKGGLGHVAGGLVLLVVSLLAWLLKPGLMLALWMSGLTLLWLIGKEILRNWLYTALGAVKMNCLPVEKRSRLLRTVLHPLEWLFGFVLLLIDTLTAIGYTNYFWWLLPLAFIVALTWIVLGVSEHLQFRALIEELQTRQHTALWKRYTSSRSRMHQDLSALRRHRTLLYILPASIVGVYALTHPLLAACFCVGTIILLALQERTALQVRFAPVYVGYATRRPLCSTISDMTHLQK